jgi:hypothetical protein
MTRILAYFSNFHAGAKHRFYPLAALVLLTVLEGDRRMQGFTPQSFEVLLH